MESKETVSEPSSSYVTYGLLQKNQDFVDWIRVECTDNNNSSIEELDGRAFELFKNGGNISNSFSIVSPETISFVVFDPSWKSLRFSPRHSNADVAILLHAALTEQRKRHSIGDMDDDDDDDDDNNDLVGSANDDAVVWRTKLAVDDLGPDQTPLEFLKSRVAAGSLPLVPVRRTSQHQFVVKQSVNAFFRKESVQFFSCGPYRNSPRTICRFDVNIPELQQAGDESTTTSQKWNQVISRVSENSANLRDSFSTKTKESLRNLKEKTANPASIRESFSNSVSKSKQSFLTLKEKTTVSNARNSFLTLKEKTSVANARNSFQNLKERTSFLGRRKQAAPEGETNDNTAAAVETEETKSEPETSDENSSSTIAADGPAGYVALTIDDVPCRFDDRDHSYLQEVLGLLAEYNAKASFMVISSFLTDSHDSDMIRLLREGHELANHGVRDEPMDKLTPEAFGEALDDCNAKIQYLQHKANDNNNDNGNNTPTSTVGGVKWFRAPQSKYTRTMEQALEDRNMYNVMCDAYAACPVVEDGPWIASALSKQISNGSIALLHMPEKCGFRDYCYPALKLLLEDLCVKRNFKVVTVSELERIAEASKMLQL